MSSQSASNGREDVNNSTDKMANTMKILVATDIHLGYAEKDAIRGDDSFNTFEEILQLSRKHEVDFILLGGDLFHDGRPTVNAINRCMALLRHYCMGERPITIEFLSDQSDNFQHSANPTVNYMDPNLNVAYPVFSIHGNHDDPLGYNAKCSLDMLSSAGLVNYFGRNMNMSKVTVSPLLLKKGTTKLAMYGFGAIKDKMMFRLFKQEQVSMLRPDDGNAEEWFNLMVLHQNRTPHMRDQYVPEHFLPSFMDLIVWGHEHENRLEPEFNEARGFYVSQPGSSVATSLSEGEAVKKQVGLLQVKGRKFIMKKLDLETVRPFVFRKVSLIDDFVPKGNTINRAHEAQCFLEKQVEEMLGLAQDQLTGHPKQPTQPLIRMRVEFKQDQELFNQVRFGIPYRGQVANPADMILMKNMSKTTMPGLTKGDAIDQEALELAEANQDLHSMEDFVEDYFKECDDRKQLQVLTVRGLNDALGVFLKKNDIHALQLLIEYQSRKSEQYLAEKEIDDINLSDEVEQMRLFRLEHLDAESQEILKMLDNVEARKKLQPKADVDQDDSSAGGKGRGRGRGGARAKATTASASSTRGGGRNSKTKQTGSEDEDDEMDVHSDEFSPPAVVVPARGRGSRGGRARATAAPRTPKVSRGSSRASASSGRLDVTISQGASKKTTQAPAAWPQRQAGGRMAFISSDESD